MKKAIWALSIFIILGTGAGAFWLYKISQPEALVSDDAITKVSGDTAATVNKPLNNTGQSLVATNSQSKATLNGPAASSTTPTTGSGCAEGKAEMDPKKFNVYDKCVGETSVKFADIKVGDGDRQADGGKKINVIYRGWLTNGTIFDQNTDTTKPFSFTLGQGSVIKGWEQGIAGMKIGGERLLIIPPSLGYGAQGNGPIPGNAVLLFDVKVVSIE